MTSSKKLSRREMLALMGTSTLSLNPLHLLTRGLIFGAIEKAYAAETGIEPRNLVTFFLNGGAARWNWDHFMTPYSRNKFVANKQVATRFGANSARTAYVEPIYQTIPYVTKMGQTIEIPWMWQFAVPKTGGGTRPMTDLLENMLALQGMNAFSGEHDAAAINVFYPPGSLQSLNALPSDGSSKPIKCVNLESFKKFYSKANNSMVDLKWSDGNQIAALMEPFVKKTGAAYNSNKNSLKTLLAGVSDSLSAAAALDRPGADTLEKNRKATLQLMESSLSSFDTAWQDALTRYRDLIRRSTNPNDRFEGINDLVIGGSAARTMMYRNSFNGHAAEPDPTPDLRTLITPTDGQHYPEGFAIAEFMIKNDICPSYHGQGLCLHNTYDDHEMGSMPATLYNFYEARLASACLLEFIDAVKAMGKFNDTVIAIVSEFTRSAHADGTGSDHAGHGNATFYSGCIPGPMILGRAYGTSPNPDPQYVGTWGEGDGTYDYGHLMSTTAKLVRVPSPFTAKAPMVGENNGQIFEMAEKMNLK